VLPFATRRNVITQVVRTGKCYCGLIIGAGPGSVDDRKCNFKSPGAAEEACGSNNCLTVFYTELLNFTHPGPGSPNSSHISCITDDVYAWTLATAQFSDDNMTVAGCTSSCKSAGFTIAGLEYDDTYRSSSRASPRSALEAAASEALDTSDNVRTRCRNSEAKTLRSDLSNT
jgi:hypothetical protein